jgi:hypothetical protein
MRGTPECVHSDNGSEFMAQLVRGWTHLLGVQTLFFEPGSPWEKEYIGSYKGKLGFGLLNGENPRSNPGGQIHHRTFAARVQYHQATQTTCVQTTCTGVPTNYSNSLWAEVVKSNCGTTTQTGGRSNWTVFEESWSKDQLTRKPSIRARIKGEFLFITLVMNWAPPVFAKDILFHLHQQHLSE